MQYTNPWILFITALIPLLIGTLWYGKNPIGNAWRKESGIDVAPPTTKKMIGILALSYFFSLLLSTILATLSVHQMHLDSLMADPATTKLLEDPSSAASIDLKHFYETYGQGFRTIKHGLLHGFLSGLFLSLSVLGITSLFEKRSGKYILIHVGYWVITCMIMSALISAYL
jgi:Protein of unknown function (DUF1761)